MGSRAYRSWFSGFPDPRDRLYHWVSGGNSAHANRTDGFWRTWSSSSIWRIRSRRPAPFDIFSVFKRLTSPASRRITGDFASTAEQRLAHLRLNHATARRRQQHQTVRWRGQSKITELESPSCFPAACPGKSAHARTSLPPPSPSAYRAHELILPAWLHD